MSAELTANPLVAEQTEADTMPSSKSLSTSIYGSTPASPSSSGQPPQSQSSLGPSPLSQSISTQSSSTTSKGSKSKSKHRKNKHSGRALPELSERINGSGAREYLTKLEWPKGLQDTLISNLDKHALRFILIDDSGSMMESDGCKEALVKKEKGPGMKKTLVECTRWAELVQTMEFHVGLARAANAPTEFRMLNGCPPITLGNVQDEDLEGNALENENHEKLRRAFKEGPRGQTPLCRHIGEITEQIKGYEDYLRSNSKFACVVIVTDGLPSDGDLNVAIEPLVGLPVWVVVRLCTGERQVIRFWNELDAELEIDVDVLDDIGHEAQEVRRLNPWLNYSKPIHRIREFGIHVKEFDLLDELRFTFDEAQKLAELIYGKELFNLDTQSGHDVAAFCSLIEQANQSTPASFNQVSKKEELWMSPALLLSTYKRRGCICS